MTDFYAGWEPSQRGAKVFFNKSEVTYDLSSTHLRELRTDMEEAAYLSRGLEKVEVFAMEIKQYDKILLGGDLVTIDSTLEQQHGWVLQCHPEEVEIVCPPDRMMTVWRQVE